MTLQIWRFSSLDCKCQKKHCIKENSSHYYEVDFLLASKTKIVALEIKSSGLGRLESITEFQKKYSGHVVKVILLSQKIYATLKC